MTANWILVVRYLLGSRELFRRFSAVCSRHTLIEKLRLKMTRTDFFYENVFDNLGHVHTFIYITSVAISMFLCTMCAHSHEHARACVYGDLFLACSSDLL